MKIENRTFIISGGSSGLGLATLEDLLRTPRAHVAVVDLSPPPAPYDKDPRVRFFRMDITKLEQVEQAVEDAVKWTEETGAALGGVINCAGVGTAAKIIDAHNEPHSLDLWNFTIAVNLTGTFNLTRLALKHLVRVAPEDTADKERGVVVLVASSAAYEAQQGQVAYSASKGAVNTMALPLARDLARHHIRAVSIAPGVFESNMTRQMPEPVRKSLATKSLAYPFRFGDPPEFAQTVRWILECPYVNGESIRLSGAGRLSKL
ncbi:hypothetical protein PLICRDRAFT_34176 [Plicaturopsis crispa FD-325 SS-3]|nr:hypothetical protein PLICRDRAFT_34176 [Plicaturopsis crispa FD-325 SS-3]